MCIFVYPLSHNVKSMFSWGILDWFGNVIDATNILIMLINSPSIWKILIIQNLSDFMHVIVAEDSAKEMVVVLKILV